MWQISRLKPEWISVRQPRLAVFRLQWSDRRSLVEPDKGIELLRQRSLRIVAHQLGIGPINDPDEPLQTRFEQPPPERFVTAGIQQEPGHASVMTKPFVAVPVRRPHALNFHVAVPVRGGSDRAGVWSETDQRTFIAEALTA